MGKRNRKQRRAAGGAGVAEGARPAGGAPPSPSPRPRLATDERPRAPWHPVPLIELCVLLGLVLIVIGFFSLGDRRGGILIICGLALGSLAGLDTVVREHFAGFRSHSILLGGVPAVLTAGVLYFARAPWLVLVIAAPAVFAGALVLFRRAFRRNSGGLSFR